MLAAILRRSGAPHAELAALVLAANAHFIVAATSLADQLWAIGFVVLGIDLFQRDRPKLAGVAWALAIGCRLASSVLVVAYLVAELAVGRRDRRSVGWSAGITFVLGVLCFVPRGSRSGAPPPSSSTIVEPTSLVRARRTFRGEALPLPRAPDARRSSSALLPRPWRASASERGNRWWCSRCWADSGSSVFLRFPWKLSHLLPSSSAW